MLAGCKHRLLRLREGGIAEGADGDADQLRHAFRFPHSGQKWKVISVPTTELRVKIFDVSSTSFTALRSKKAAIPNKLPVRC